MRSGGWGLYELFECIFVDVEFVGGEVDDGFEVLLLQDTHILLVLIAEGLYLALPITLLYARVDLDLLLTNQILQPPYLILHISLLILLVVMHKAQVALKQRILLHQLRYFALVHLDRLIQRLVESLQLYLARLSCKSEG